MQCSVRLSQLCEYVQCTGTGKQFARSDNFPSFWLAKVSGFLPPRSFGCQQVYRHSIVVVSIAMSVSGLNAENGAPSQSVLGREAHASHNGLESIATRRPAAGSLSVSATGETVASQGERQQIPSASAGRSTESVRLQRPTAPSLGERLHDFKSWSVCQFKCTRQYLAEQWGRGSRTLDEELVEKISGVRTMRVYYQQFLTAAIELRKQLVASMETQRSMSALFQDMVPMFGLESELGEDAKQNSSLNRQIAQQGEPLRAALTAFIKGLTTVVNVTLDDTLNLWPVYESARMEYDAYRSDVESLTASLAASGGARTNPRLERLTRELAPRQKRFETVRHNLKVHLQFFEEHHIGVTKRQLVLLQNAVVAYYTSDKELMDKCLKHFHIRAPPSRGTGPSLGTPPKPLPMRFPSQSQTPTRSASSEAEEDNANQSGSTAEAKPTY